MFGGIIDKLKEYVDTRLQLYQVTLEEKATNLVATIVYMLILIGVGVVTAGFLLLFLAKTKNSMQILCL